VGCVNSHFPGKSHGWATRSGVVASEAGASHSSLWLLLAIAVPPGESEPWSRALFYLATVLTLAGIPFLTALLLRVTIAGYEQIPSRRRLVAAAVVALVAIASFGLGQFNNRFLTCSDFIVSGNDTPPGCAQGQGHLGKR
jgi:hypothetical protein